MGISPSRCYFVTSTTHECEYSCSQQMRTDGPLFPVSVFVNKQSLLWYIYSAMNVSIDKSTVHRVVHCMQSNSTACPVLRHGAPLLELSCYLF